jgi:multicomponent Na+:H+ antiporter subunit E
MILVLGILISTAAIFALVVSDFSAENAVVSLALSGMLMLIFRRQVIPSSLPPNGLALHLIIYAPVLFWFLFIDIVKGTWQVLSITVGMRPLVQPGIVKIPIGAHTPAGVGPVGFFVTLSPGTFLVDIDWEEEVMLVHSIDASNPDGVRKDAEKYYRLWEYGTYLPEGMKRELEEGGKRDD